MSYPQKDPGCYHRDPEVLQPLQSNARHALVLLDREGSGQEMRPASEIEDDLTSRLAQSGWTSRAAAFVPDPELEAWVWADSAQVDSTLGWAGHVPSLRSWLRGHGFWPEGAAKPERPKKRWRRL